MDFTVFENLESEVRAYCRNWPVVFDRARGSYVYDEEGREYLDFFTGVATLSYGHNQPALKEALLEYIAEDGLMHSLDTYTVAKRRFMESFQNLILRPRQLDYKIAFTGPTGANAVEAALKLARKVTGRTTIARFTNGFHGLSLGALALTGNALKRAAAGVPLTNAMTLPYDGYLDDPMVGLDMLRKVIEDRGSGVDIPAAVIVECVQGEGGINAASSEWLRELRRVCDDHGLLLIVDDVLMGCGRTGSFFSFEAAGIKPDMVCMSKALSGYGLPMALLLLRADLDIWQPGEHSGTFRGSNPAFVTAHAALETFWADDALEKQIDASSQHLVSALHKIAACHPESGAMVKGRGLALGLHLEPAGMAQAVCQEAFDHGLLVESCGSLRQVIMLLPPLNVTADQVGTAVDILTAAVDRVAGNA